MNSVFLKPIEPYIKSYWGKYKTLDDLPEKMLWHPLAYHSLDVAAAMEAILDIRPRYVQEIAKKGAFSETEVKHQLILMAALHDIGKFAQNFQSKNEDLAKEISGHTLNSEDWLRYGHGDVGYTFWKKCKDRIDPTFKKNEYFDDWLHAAFSHHGTPATEINLGNAIASSAIDDAQNYIKDIFDLFGWPERKEIQRSEKNALKEATWCIAGLVILADWLGSNAEKGWFPYEKPDFSLADYWKKAQEKAKTAITEAQLAEAAIATHFDLKSYFKEDVTATPLQKWAEQQQPNKGSHLYIIEDFTGAGKTEAALILAHRLMQSGSAEGIYWALPTMATANGLYARIEKGYRALFADNALPSLVLAHSARDFHKKFQISIEGVSRYKKGSNDPDDIPAEVNCAAFFAENKKYTFLAQFGIGTIDQALIAVLPVRHNNLRLAALSRRVLIIDEAHSFDGYMTKGIEALIEFQAALGGSVIILSATLIQAQKRGFVQAFGGDYNVVERNAPFPLVTYVDPEKHSDEYPLAALRGSRRDLPVKFFSSVEQVLETILFKASQGNCVLYIRNTVSEALEAYEWLKDHAPETVKLHLFHARFCLKDRQERENEILMLLGKESTIQQRAGQIVIATQVVEQSLDLDADYMATDLCPMDLLIQRAGRLHRHTHRPDRSPPELWLVSHSAIADAPEDWVSSLFPKGQYVYSDFGQLWRTVYTLEKMGGLPCLSQSPRSLIEPVFDKNGDCPEALQQASNIACSKRNEKRSMANFNFLKIENEYKETLFEVNAKTPTRLDAEGVTLRLGCWGNGHLTPWAQAEDERLAWRLSEITLRHNQFKEVAEIEDASLNASVQKMQDQWSKHYEAPRILPLRSSPEKGVWENCIIDPSGKERKVYYSFEKGLSII
ncbi:CRISPR-associated helicase/endonuclease Cas3 [Zymomonas mobilis]|uniref:Metal dependent phosphohydrolase n=1 Tax=Zymomonas mobilis subsp. pomaceae (strain ATCC 29192 / DSM 22645 / JCM 10191 / CCUG 17912 / NBRC 13757 / NCIMB 11200 / NRRL B-4491 / Barker I) TaxID=579138 RepID=F8ET08_ZYMMT|nr:CRISPR-associated helicase/endonuclease Cas3 [Zymomonas mobilis]AEI37912.1 metal dependent phosphohydrolase [Zymomonas mobilis subsp. pomaceae ATCC 29192]MDX5949280.1 CRISPR-associated helicase/endonuclease Cas3 [Zymomonas mobilis subsp. pomaceae]GEB89713.1 CRISPR-associated helicase/endonuclease Cas3 [Zymomonas mobilis subsp. pomaceae]